MANEFIARNGLIALDNSTITGSLTVTGGITGSLLGTASFASTASFVDVSGLNVFAQGGNSFGAQALLGTNDNQDLAFETNGSVRMFISSSGNIGIGTNTPAYSLEAIGSNFRFSRGSTVDFDIANTGLGRILRLSAGTSDVVIQNLGSYDIGFNNNFSRVMTLTPTGLVGIGTTSPTSRLQVRGSGATSSTTALRIENSNASASLVVLDDGNVGIGMTNPNSTLHVSGAAGGTAAFEGDSSQTTLLLKQGANLNYIVGVTNNISFRPNGTEALYLRGSNSNVGIGTSSPSSRLHVSGTVGTGLRVDGVSSTGIVVQAGDLAGGSGTVELFAGNNNNSYLRLASEFIREGAGGGLGINVTRENIVSKFQVRGTGTTSSSTTLRVENNNASASLVVLDNGFVGIGTGSAQYRLDVNGIARIGDQSSSGQLYIKGLSGTGQYIYLDNGAGNTIWTLLGGANYEILENSTSRFAVRVGGNVGINTNNPQYTLHVSGSGNIFASNRVIAGGVSANAADPDISTRSTIAGLFEPSYANLGFTSFGGEAGRIETANRYWNIGMTGGTAKLNVRGSGSSSSTTAFLIQNSTPTNIFTVRDDGANFSVSSTETISTWTHTNGNYFDLKIGNGSALASTQAGFYLNGTRVISFTPSQINLGTVSAINASGNPMTLRGGLPSSPTNLTGTTGIFLGAGQGSTGPLTSGSGVLDIVNVGYRDTNDTWAMTTGSATLNVLKVQHRLNTSNTYSGIVRGIYYDPILVSTTGITHRAIETTSGDILFQSGSTPLFFVSSSGNVGIGTSTPSARFQVRGTGDSSIWITSEDFNAGTNTGTVVRLGTTNSTGNSAGTIDVLNSGISSYGNLTLARLGGNVSIGTVTNSARLQVRGTGATSSTTALRIENSNASSSMVVLDNGNVGINTGSAQYALDIAGTTTLNQNIIRIRPGSNAMSPQLIVDDDSERRLALGTNANGGIFSSGNLNYAAVLGSPAGYDVQFFTINTARMTILAANGNIGIGTNAPNARLDVSGNAIISSSLSVGTSSLGPSENTLTLGARDTANEGGQIGFNAPGGTYTSASFIDNYQNRFRLLKGTNAGSSAELIDVNLHDGTININGQTGGTPTEQGVSAGVVSNFWGTEDGKFLSTPAVWLKIKLDGVTYYLPAYE